MLDFILGVLALFCVFVILVLKESDNKYLAYIGIGIILLIKLLH